MRDKAPDPSEIPDRPYTIRDPDDQFSLINMLSDRLKQAVMELDEEWLLKSEGELKQFVKPTPVDHALRVSFWREFDKAMWLGKGKIVCSSIFGGVCTEQYFYNKVIVTPAKFAWMIRPMQTYQKEMDAILYLGTQRLWELMRLPIKGKNGKIDAKMADVVLRTIVQVENRVKGMAVQRTESKTLAVHMRQPSKALQGNQSLESLDKQIKELEAEVEVKGLPEAQEAPPAEVEINGMDRVFIQVDHK